jgi:activator of HSP90 ATPase
VNTFDSLPVPECSSNRRQWLVGVAAAIGGLAVGSSYCWAETDNGLSHNAEAIHQEPVFKAKPQRIYDALTDAQRFQKVQLLIGTIEGIDLRAHPVQISQEPGGSFSLFGDYIVGRQLELVPNQRIVQAWREVSWGPGIFSIARFELKEQGPKTKLIFDHTGFPTGNGEHLAVGWKAHYWEPLEKYLS